MDKQPPIVVNSFPKSGTHLVSKFIHPVGDPCQRFISFHPEPPFFSVRIFSTHKQNSWGRGVRELKDIIQDFEKLWPGEYAGAHLAAIPELVNWMKEQGWAVIFCYRDLFDIAVSQAYHIEGVGNGRKVSHVGHDEYMALPNHEARIEAVITGLNDWPGLMERWNQWAGWLNEDWVCPVIYREARHQPLDTAKKILYYLSDRIGLEYSDELAERMASTATTGGSKTFRKGKVGGWKDEMGPELTLLAGSELGEANERIGQTTEVVYGNGERPSRTG